MTEQLALTLAAASVGFVSAVFFCIGNALNSAKKIERQATPQWDFMESVARALTAQRAQYVVGALLLVASFLLQVAASLSSPTTPSALPRFLHTWPYLVLAVLVPTGLIAGGLSVFLYKSTIRKVLSLAEERKRRVEAELKNRGRS